jgi:hypothetical protein
MNDAVLLELARRWENDAKTPDVQIAAGTESVPQAISKCERRVKRECADTLRMLVSMLGDGASQK